MRSLLVLVYICVAFITQAYHPAERKNYYLLLSADKRSVELGEYIGSNYKMKKILRTHPDSLTKQIFTESFGLKNDSSELFVYLHCWLGNEKTFHRMTLKSLNETTADCRTMKKTLSIVWASGLRGYSDSWRAAGDGGHKLSKVLRWLAERKTGSSSFFCHSMGNRMFEGMIEKTDLSKFKNKVFNEVVLAAADIHPSAFRTSLKDLPRLSRRVHILKHSHDRMLLSSSLVHGLGRMGRHGPENCDSLLKKINNIYIVDASAEKPYSSLDLSNHVYFYKGRLVRNYLSTVYSHRQFCEGKAERAIRLN